GDQLVQIDDVRGHELLLFAGPEGLLKFPDTRLQRNEALHESRIDLPTDKPRKVRGDGPDQKSSAGAHAGDPDILPDRQMMAFADPIRNPGAQSDEEEDHALRVITDSPPGLEISLQLQERLKDVGNTLSFRGAFRCPSHIASLAPGTGES